MKEIICAVISLFLSLSTWVNAWPQQLPISGSPENSIVTPIVPKISVSPPSVNCGNLNPGGTSESAVTIKNSGKGDLVISSITISGNNPSDFSQTNHCTTIAAGSSCAVTVTFGPTSGGKKSATLSITSNDPKKPTTNVKLSGSAKSPVCSYSLSSSSQQCDASGGTWSVNVIAPSGCSWTATTKTSWITITSGGSGIGNGTVAYAVTPNTSTRQRTGKMTIAKQTFTVTQSGAGPSCTYSISSASQDFNAAGGTGSVGVTTQSTCNWTAASNTSWVTITSGASGSGAGSVGYNVSANTGAGQRTGTMTIAGQTFTVTQSAVTCTFSISQASQSFDSKGGTGSVNVSSASGCNWTAASSTDWITITSGSSGSGNGTVNFTVASNVSTSQRAGTMTIAKQTFTVTQAGAPACPTPGTLSNPSPSNGATGVTSNPTLGWSSTSNTDSYDVYSGTSPNPPYVGNTTGASYPLSGLTPDSTYSWKVVARNACGNSTPGPVWSFTTQSSLPASILSEYQQALLDTYGGPDYLSVGFNPAPPRRVETWVYLDMQKMYLFWDGESLGETSITVDPNAYSNPPSLDPSIFTKDIKLSDLVEILGSDYSEVDLGILKGIIGEADFKIYQFRDEALFLALLNGNVVAVQTIDIPENAAPTSFPTALSQSKEQARDTDNVAQYATPFLGVLIYEQGGIDVKNDPAFQSIATCSQDDSECIKSKLIQTLNNGGKALQGGAAGLANVGQQVETVDTATTKCNGKNAKAQATGDTFPNCPGSCTYSLSATAASFNSAGGTGSFEVTAPTGCAWTAASSADWVTISSGSSARTKIQPLLSLVSTVTYTVAANTSSTSRTGTITVAGLAFTVTQEGTASCTYSLSATAASFDSAGGTGSFDVTAPTGCAWTAVKNVDWITITSGSSARTKIQPLLSLVSTVAYTVAANTSSTSRTGTITVAGLAFTVTQAGPPSCTSYTSSDSTCENVPWNGIVGLGTITTTYIGVPLGCVGGVTIPPPVTRCCVLDPC
jgi:hypothetical protein